jgi:hypothetical protein
MLLAKLDVSNHNGPYVSIAGHNIPELAILGHVSQSSSKCVTQYQIRGTSPKLLRTGNFGANIAINDHTWSLLIILRLYKPFLAAFVLC